MVEPKKLVRPIELTLITPAGEAHPVQMKFSPFVIGRHESCDMVLNSRSVSRLHCQLKLKSFGLTVKDLESRNRTYLDEEPIAPKERIPLKEGSLLRIGKFRLRVDRIYGEVEVAEGGALLLDAQSQTAELSQNLVVEEPDQLLEELENFILLAHQKRQPDGKQRTRSDAQKIDSAIVASTDKTSSHPSKETIASPASVDTALTKTHETVVAGSASHSNTIGESEDVELDASEVHRLRLREQLNAMKPRDSKEAAIQALRNLFTSR